MKLVQMMCPASKYGMKAPYAMTPDRIVVHNTYNDASARNEISFMIRNNNQISFHFAVDDLEAVQGLPLDRNGWHAGDGANGKGNRRGIGVEICHSKTKGNPRWEQSEKNGARLVAMLLKQYGWGIDKVTKHQDYSGKYCPHRILDNGWQRFLTMVQGFLNELNGGNQSKPEKPAVPPTETPNKIYRVRKSWGDSASQLGAYRDKGNAVATAKAHAGYSVFDEGGNIIYGGVENHAELAVGDKVKIKSGAKYGGLSGARGMPVPSKQLAPKAHTILKIATNKGVKEALLKEISSWVSAEYLYR